ncbi:hypothetical protein B0H13DRAFT_1850988 [Mycena leptocephala]|nr:hypothetical protein B0H13DRAFT_1850988 [Mycena leptocephala]
MLSDELKGKYESCPTIVYKGAYGRRSPVDARDLETIIMSSSLSLDVGRMKSAVLAANTALISSVTWLPERERSNVQLRKYSGTLDHPRYSDKQGATTNVFQHFSYFFSNKTLVLTSDHFQDAHGSKANGSALIDLGICSVITQEKRRETILRMGQQRQWPATIEWNIVRYRLADLKPAIRG